MEHGRAMLRQQGSLSDAKQLMSGGPAVAGLQATQSSSGGSSHDAAAVRELEARLAQVSLQPKETKARSASAASSASSAAAAKTKTKVTGTKASAKAAGGAQDAAGAPSPLASLLHALQLCWSSPLLAAQVCSELVHAAWAQGMVHTAAMFLHLSIGLPQQQQLCIAAKEQAVPWSQSVATSTSSSAAGEEDCAKQDRDQQRSAPPSQRQGLASRLQDLLSSAHKLVAQALAGNDGSKAGGVDAQSLDSKAAAWLDSLLAQLPGDSAVAGITCLPGPAGGSAQAGGGLVLSRLARGSVPVLMLLPEPPQEKTPSWSREQDCSKEQQQQGMGTGKGPASTLVSMLANLLERSSQSMKTAELQTAAQKAQWWKVRLCCGRWEMLLWTVYQIPCMVHAHVCALLQFFIPIPALLLIHAFHSHGWSWTSTCVSCLFTWSHTGWAPGVCCCCPCCPASGRRCSSQQLRLFSSTSQHLSRQVP